MLNFIYKLIKKIC